MATRHPGAPSLARETVTQAVRIMAATALAVASDIKAGGGAVH